LPLYEYQCAACGEPVEIRHGFRETVEQPCAKCGGELKRVFTPAGIVFKGSGFYPGSASSASASSGSSGSSAGASSSESAPSTPAATTTEAKTPPKDGGSPGKSEAAA
jgi:putative FmdB family regulatory protein